MLLWAGRRSSPCKPLFGHGNNIGSDFLSFFRERQICAEAGEGCCETTPKPGLDSRRLDDCGAEHMGEETINYEHDERHRHECSAQDQKLKERFSRPGLHKLRQEGQEKDGQFRIENVEQERLSNQTGRRSCGRACVNDKSRLVTPGGEGNVEQVGDARVLHGLKSKRACVHDGCQAKNGSQEMRHDASRAPKCRKHACLPPLDKTGGYGIDDARARNEHHNERCDQKFKGEHLVVLLG